MSVLDLNEEELKIWRDNRYSMKKIIQQLIAERETTKQLHEEKRSKMVKVKGQSFLDSPMVAVEGIKKNG